MVCASLKNLASVLKCMENISRDELKRLIDTKGAYTLIDVRQPEELQHGMIPTATNLPLQDFESAWHLDDAAFQAQYHFPKPKKEDSIIFYCRTGGRSAAATEYAKEKGYVHVQNYAGSIYDWAEIDPNVRRY